MDSKRHRRNLLIGMAALAAAGVPQALVAQPQHFDIPAESGTRSVPELARQAGVQIIGPGASLRSLHTPALHGTYDVRDALQLMLRGSRLQILQDTGGILTIGERPVSLPQNPQEGAAATAQSDIVVTGTHLRGAENVAAPVKTLTRQAIDESGYSTVEGLVGTIPQNFSEFSAEGARNVGGSLISNQNQDYATGIDLRGLGPQSTLTLVNGQRVAASANGRVVDVTTIPLALIDHIDVVTDGNSAVYGSDAVGGVVNLVMRHSFDGAETDVYYGGGAHGGDRVDASQVVGHQFDHGGFVLGYDFARETSFDLVKAGFTVPTPAGAVAMQEAQAPDSTRHSLYAAGEYEITPSVKLHGDFSYTWKTDRLTQITGYRAYNEIIGTDLDHRFRGYLGDAGVTIALPASWSLDLSGSRSRDDIDLRNPETLTTFTGSLIRDIPYNTTTSSSVTSGSIVANGSLSFLGRTAKIALGAEARWEGFSFYAPAGVTVFQNSDATRRVASVFGEAEVPIIPADSQSPFGTASLSFAGRYDNYSDAGHSFNPQAGLLWSPGGGVKLRGSYSTAYRAPDLYTLHQGSLDELLNSSVCDAKGCSVRPTLNLNFGNPNLRPETAKTYSLGAELDPPEIPDLHLSLSYFSVDYRDRITNPVIVLPASSVTYPGFVITDPTPAQVAAYLSVPGADAFQNYTGRPFNSGTQTLLQAFPNLAIIDDRAVNVAIEKVRGLDFSAGWNRDTAIGKLSVLFDGTYTLKHTDQVTPGSSVQDVYDRVGLPAAFRFRAKIGINRGPFDLTGFVNHTGSYANQYTVPVSRIGSWTTFDATLVIDGSKLSNARILTGFRLIFSAQNLTNSRPPYFYGSTNGLVYDAGNANTVGRFLSVRISKKW